MLHQRGLWVFGGHGGVWKSCRLGSIFFIIFKVIFIIIAPLCACVMFFLCSPGTCSLGTCSLFSWNMFSVLLEHVPLEHVLCTCSLFSWNMFSWNMFSVMFY